MAVYDYKGVEGNFYMHTTENIRKMNSVGCL